MEAATQQEHLAFDNHSTLPQADSGYQEQHGTNTSETGNSYILILIDARSHTFTPAMLQSITEGADPAAVFHEHLKRAIEQNISGLVSNHDPSVCRLDIRIHATTSRMNRKVVKKLRQIVGRSENFSLYLIKSLPPPGAWTVQQRISRAFLKALADDDCKHILFAAWKRTEYLGVLQSASPKVTVVESRAMGRGFESVPISCGFIQIPSVFETALGSDVRLEENLSLLETSISAASGGLELTCRALRGLEIRTRAVHIPTYGDME